MKQLSTMSNETFANFKVWFAEARAAMEDSSVKAFPNCDANHTTLDIEMGRKYIKLVRVNAHALRALKNQYMPLSMGKVISSKQRLGKLLQEELEGISIQ